MPYLGFLEYPQGKKLVKFQLKMQKINQRSLKVSHGSIRLEPVVVVVVVVVLF